MGGARGRAPGCKFQICSSLKPGRNLSNLLPVPRETCALLEHLTPYLPLLQCHSLRKCSSCSCGRSFLSSSALLTVPRGTSQHVRPPHTPLHTHCGRHGISLSSCSPLGLQEAHSVGVPSRWRDVRKVLLGCLPLLVVLSSGGASPASGGGAAPASRGAGPAAPARGRGAGGSPASQRLVPSV